MKTIVIKDDMITLGQLLKLADCVSTGGQVKPFLLEVAIRVNGEPEARRGRKLYPGDTIDVEGHGQFKVGKAN